MLRPLSTRSPLSISPPSREADAALSPITPPACAPATQPLLNNLGVRYKPTPLPSPKVKSKLLANLPDGKEPSPPPRPHPHPHPDPDPRPATPATPPERDLEEEDPSSEEVQAERTKDSQADQGMPSLVSTRQMSVSSSTTTTSFSSATKDKDGFIEDVSTLLSTTTMDDAPAVFSDDDESYTAEEDEDRPWVHGRNEAERRYSNEMRAYVLGVVENMMRSGREGETTAKKTKKRGSIRGRDSSVIFET